MRKIISLMIAAIMVFALCSCGQTAEDETIPEYELEAGSIDFRGAEFSFAQRNEEHSTGEDYFGYVVNTEFADLAMRRIKEVESKYNVKISVDSSGSDITNLIVSMSLSGIVPYDALQAQSSTNAGLARAGYLYDLTVLGDVINYLDAAKWGTKEDLKPVCWDGGLFGVIPAAWPMLKYRSIDGAMVVNENIISRLSQTDPREFVEADDWTWRKLEELMPIYTHINDFGDEVKALQTTVHWLFRTIHTTNGEPPVIKDEKGEFQLGLHSPITFEAMQTAWNWTFGEYSTYVNIDLSNNWTNMLQNFLDGKSVLTLMNGTDLCGGENSIAFNMENFGIVPFPHGPNGSLKNTGSTITTTRFTTSIPAFCKEPVMSATILDAIYEPLPGYETEDDTIEYMRKQYFFDDRDVHNFVEMYKTILYNYRHEGITDVYINIRDNKTMQESLDAIADADEANRIKYVVNMESTAEEIFG
ncbi:MAG: hypothetical protein IJK34_03545 [Clostridia bacterium]|nr:hypothetical protein [Clostridia bacterium]